MNPLETLTEALDAAQNELKSAEIGFLEAQVRVEEARRASERLETAVAALKGEFSAPTEPPTGGETAEGRQSGSRPDSASKPKKVQEDLSNPYRNTKCPGCGVTGKLHEHVKQAPSGAVVKMLVCGKCNNQMMMG